MFTQLQAKLFKMIVPQITLSSALALLIVTSVFALAYRVIYNLYFHPLARFPGPWYAASFSVSAAIISLQKKEPQWLLGLVRKYGSMVSPNLAGKSSC